MRRESVVLVCLLCLLSAAVPCGAATFIVNRTEDDPTATACDETLPPESRNCSLREAIIATNLSPGVDTITLPMGTYWESPHRPGLSASCLATRPAIAWWSSARRGCAETCTAASGKPASSAVVRIALQGFGPESGIGRPTSVFGSAPFRGRSFCARPLKTSAT